MLVWTMVAYSFHPRHEILVQIKIKARYLLMIFFSEDRLRESDIYCGRFLSHFIKLAVKHSTK